jgi:hypothetical protein
MTNKKMSVITVLLFSILFISRIAWAGPVLQDFQGDAQILKKGSAAWTPAEKGMALEAGDKVKTGEKGSATIEMDQGTITLAERTEFGIKTYEIKGDEVKSVSELSLGKLKAKVAKLQGGSKFEIMTPTAVAAVRGTFFNLWVFLFEGDWFTRLDVEDGTVNFKDEESGDNYDVGEGEHATAGGGGITPPSKNESDTDLGEGFNSPEGFNQDTFGSQSNEEGNPNPPEEPPPPPDNDKRGKGGPGL